MSSAAHALGGTRFEVDDAHPEPADLELEPADAPLIGIARAFETGLLGLELLDAQHALIELALQAVGVRTQGGLLRLEVTLRARPARQPADDAAEHHGGEKNERVFHSCTPCGARPPIDRGSAYRVCA